MAWGHWNWEGASWGQVLRVLQTNSTDYKSGGLLAWPLCLTNARDIIQHHLQLPTMTVQAAHFTPEVLLSSPRRSAGAPNSSGELVLYTVRETDESFNRMSPGYLRGLEDDDE